ncbi:MAG TPA: proton-conducting transporter membrane subunit, partial [Hyphomicrobiaceae bacterium]|nr:proton-conducting transporter membrane subunit [Hyphomicrobiaceae bacterium]
MTQLETYAPLLPEAIVAVGAMALLVFGVFRPETDAEGRSVAWAAIAVLAAAGLVVLRQPGGTETVFEGAFVIDTFGRFMKLLVLAGSAAALLLAFDDLSDQKQLKFEYPVLVLLATAGMLMMVSAGDLIALYLGLELQSLALYVLAAFRRDSVRSSEAG